MSYDVDDARGQWHVDEIKQYGHSKLPWTHETHFCLGNEPIPWAPNDEPADEYWIANKDAAFIMKCIVFWEKHKDCKQ